MNIFTKIKESGKWVLIFLMLKMLIIMIEQLLLYIFDTQSLNILWELEILLLQCFSFFVITLLTAKWINRKYYYFVFPIIIFLFLNFVLLFSLHIMFEDRTFYINIPSFANTCWNYGWNIITTVLIKIKPFYCWADGGFLSHFNVFYFYILYAVTLFIYFFGLTCLCSYIVKKKFKRIKNHPFKLFTQVK